MEIWKLLETRQNLQGNGKFATDEQVHLWTSDGDPISGLFHQTCVTTGDTGVMCEYLVVLDSWNKRQSSRFLLM